MKRCDSVQMRKNLELVDEMARAGMDFFPVPVVSEEHRKQLASQAHDIMNVVMGIVVEKRGDL